MGLFFFAVAVSRIPKLQFCFLCVIYSTSEAFAANILLLIVILTEEEKKSLMHTTLLKLHVAVFFFFVKRS